MTIRMTCSVIAVSAVLVLSCGQTDTNTQTHTNADEHYTLVGVSN